LNSALAICNFSGLRQWDFAKTEGWLQVWMWCSTPWVGVGFTSPVRRIEGNFCNKVFTSAGTESGFFIRGWGSNSHLGILD
jgi:hypothetical protein